MRAIITDPSGPHRLVLGHVPDADPQPDEVVVRVEAISLNQDEVRRAVEDGPSGGVQAGISPVCGGRSQERSCCISTESRPLQPATGDNPWPRQKTEPG